VFRSLSGCGFESYRRHNYIF